MLRQEPREIEVIPMPPVVIEGPAINFASKRSLVRKPTALVASAYGGPLEKLVVIPSEDPGESLAQGGSLRVGGERPRRSRQVE